MNVQSGQLEERKTSIVGVCSYSPRVLRWLTTLRDKYSGHCALCVWPSISSFPKRVAEKFQVELYYYPIPDFRWNKFYKVWEYLWHYTKSHRHFDHIIRTDVHDVVFQDDPSKHVSDGIWVCGEGWKISEDGPFKEASKLCLNWMSPEYIRVGQTVINGGIICANNQKLLVLSRLIASNQFGATMDQADLNLLASTFSESFKIAPLEFMSCLWASEATNELILDSGIYKTKQGVASAVVHGNGASGSKLDQAYPVEAFSG